MTPGEYVRAVEAHVCQKNDGHLIRVVGPAFERVTGWLHLGVPLKVALRGIDRYFERYYRSGPRRRPVRVEFCDADVLDVFDEWRRAVGVAARVSHVETDAGSSAGAPEAEDGPAPPGGEAPSDHVASRGPSLPAHLERVLTRLSSARASGALGPDTDALVDRVAEELDRARASVRGLRGDARRALIERLTAIDRELLDVAGRALSPDDRSRLERDADDELAGYRAQMPPDAYARARRVLIERAIREQLNLPVVAFD